MLSSQRLFDAQKQLGYANKVTIDRDVAMEVTGRAGATTMLCGSIVKADKRWILAGQLIDVGSGEVIRSQRIEGSDFFALIDDLSVCVREDLALEADSTGEVDVAVRTKTSESLDAIRHYLAGTEYLSESSLESAIAEFRRAVEIDPGFSQAYFKMGIAQWWADDVAADFGRASIARILDDSRSLSERDSMLAEGALALIDRRFTEAIGVFESLVEKYPDDKEAYYVLGLAYEDEVDALWLDKALAAFSRARELDPTFVLPYSEICDVYMYRRDCDLLQQTAESLIDVRPDSPMGYRHLVDVSVCRGDSLGVERAVIAALTYHRGAAALQRLYYHIGSLFNRTRNDRESERFTRLALAEDPETGDYRIYAQLGDALINRHRVKEARVYYEKGLALDTLSSWCLGGLVYVGWMQRDFDSAIRYSEKLVGIRPQSPRRHAELFQSLVSAHRLEEADSALAAGLQSIPSITGKQSLLCRAATSCLHAGRADDGRRMLRQADALGPSSGSVEIYGTLAILANAGRAYEEAKRWAERALELAPDSPAQYEELIRACLYGGDPERAVALARRIVESDSLEIIPFNTLAEVLIMTGRTAQADSFIAETKSVRSSMPWLADFLGCAAECYRKIGNMERAEDLYGEALEIAPGNERRRTSLALLYELRGRFDEARAVYNDLLSAKYDDLHIWNSLGRLNHRQGRLEEAERCYGKALEVDESDPRSLRELACLYADTGRLSKARTAASRAASLEPTCISRAALAWILVMGKSDPTRGEALAETAIRTPPLNDPTDEWIDILPFIPLPEHTLGLARLQRGDCRRAVEILELAREKRPGDERIVRDLRLARERMEQS